METTFVPDSLPQTLPTATPQSTPVGKPHAGDMSSPPADDHRQPINPRRRATPPGALSDRHGRGRIRVAAGSVVACVALAVSVHYYVAAHGHEATKAVVAGHIVQVAPQVAGQVLQVLVAANQAVQAGDLLVQIDPTDYVLKLQQSMAAANEALGLLEQARWQLLAAEAAQALAQGEILRARTSGKKRTAKRTTARWTMVELKATAAAVQVNLAQVQIATAEARVAASEAALTRASLDFLATEVRAPRSGRVRTTTVEPGEYVPVGKELLSLVSDDRRGPAQFKANQLPPRPLALLWKQGRLCTFRGWAVSLL